jgi:hypothetical protein
MYRVASAFISYKHGAQPDERLAAHFAQSLSQYGHHVFVDKQIRIGQSWPELIQAELDAANFVIVLLSKESIASEMIIEEVRISHELKKKKGTPIILPVRISYTERLPYDLGAMLARTQYAFWEKEGDETNIIEQLKTAISQGCEFPVHSNLQLVSKSSTLATDGNQLKAETAITPPLPAFDPRWLDQLDPPGGTIRLQSPFYIERKVDQLAKMTILQRGVTLRIKGSRQMGKSSLLARLYQHGKDHNCSALLYVDFQRLDNDQLRDIDTLLFYLANLVASKLKTNKPPDRYWHTALSSKDKFTLFMESEVLECAVAPVVLLLDEVDRLFTCEEYRDDFFSFIRFWHNHRAIEPLWKLLNIVLGYSTEAFMFITDMNQSPFNVGTDFILEDFNSSQVEELNIRHESPIQTPQDMNHIIGFLQGHPFLTRKALYDLVIGQLTVSRLMNQALNDDGPFSDHLHRYLWWFNSHPELRTAMKSAIKDQTCASDEVFYQLRSVHWNLSFQLF